MASTAQTLYSTPYNVESQLVLSMTLGVSPEHEMFIYSVPQTRLQEQVQHAAAAEARLGLVMDAVERCQAPRADLDELADAYGALLVRIQIRIILPHYRYLI